MFSFSDAVGLTKSTIKFDRDRGIEVIKKIISGENVNEVYSYVENGIDQFLVDKDVNWTDAHSLLSILRLIISNPSCANIPAEDKILQIAIIMLDHAEYRVRIEAGLVIGDVSRLSPKESYMKTIDVILKLIYDNLGRQPPDQNAEMSFGNDQTEQLLHETAGWKILETSMKALQELIKSCMESTLDILTPNIFSLLFQCAVHTNRFVRETCIFLFETLFSCSINIFDIDSEKLKSEDIFDKTVKSLELLLCDNWSQVRLAASQAARKFLLMVNQNSQIAASLRLLPPICLNRHYIAEGVRLYNRETWNILTNGNGKYIVGENVDTYVKFYISQSHADNQDIREASCHCLSELGCLLASCMKDSHLKLIYEALNFSFKDDSWLVRDTACLALGIHVSSHPHYFADKLGEIFPLFSFNLSDSIHSVRQGAAVAFARTLNCFPQETFNFLNEYINQKFKSVLTQPQNSGRYSHAEKGTTTSSGAKDIHDGDKAHTNQVMFSCCSLGPKSKSGKDNDCCSGGHRKDPQPWEISDGCICLLGELSTFFLSANHKTEQAVTTLNPESLKKTTELLTKNMSTFSQIIKHREFDVHTLFLQTALRYLPPIIQYIGIRSFKEKYLDLFLDTLEYCAIRTNNDHLKLATLTCFGKLKTIFGAKILTCHFIEYFGQSSSELLTVLANA